MAKAGQDAAAAMMVVLLTATGAAANEQAPQMVITVHNLCLPAPVLKDAQSTVDEIYAAIGVRIHWRLYATADASNGAAGMPAVLALLPATSEAELFRGMPAADRPRTDVAGLALAAGRRAYVFCGRVADVASKSRIWRLEIAMGRAIAHEIGHLVLPGLGHADTGVMRGALDLVHPDTPQFTPEQGAAIRQRLMRFD